MGSTWFFFYSSHNFTIAQIWLVSILKVPQCSPLWKIIKYGEKIQEKNPFIQLCTFISSLSEEFPRSRNPKKHLFSGCTRTHHYVLVITYLVPKVWAVAVGKRTKLAQKKKKIAQTHMANKTLLPPTGAYPKVKKSKAMQIDTRHMQFLYP